ncbi:MAG: biopolymer transporter ExbD, partial [Bdellovibrionaceae bacterium]|nr:biopolymer transporter ExbD [Pseudobdellovibrionaceae bacterium]
FDPSETIKLPQASSVDGDKKGDQSSVAVLNIENGRYILDGKAIERSMIASALKLRKANAGGEIRLVIQADESTDFDLMSPLFLSTAEAGVSKLEFAVQEVERTK